MHTRFFRAVHKQKSFWTAEGEGVPIAIYTIGDLHLSLSGNHSMEVFSGWSRYVERIEKNWRAKITDYDTVVLPGDTSWGMSLEGALADFQFLESLPGKKILLKGNHDYWWSTKNKVSTFFSEHGLNSLEILNNNSIAVEGTAVCGSRGWLFETGEAFDAKIINREAIRLELSIAEAEKTGGTPVVFLHYPPVYGENESPQILDVLVRHRIKLCYYGHIHAAGCRWAIDGTYMGIKFRLVSSDYLEFNPLLVEAVE